VSLVSSDSDNRICAGEAVTFTANSDIATTYKFYLDASLVQDSTSPIYTTNSLNNGQVLTVRATTANSCSVVSSGITTTVYALPAVSLVSSDADNSICAGELVTFTATSNIAATYEFFVGTTLVQSGASATYTSGSLSSGQTVAVRAITANGCSAVSSGITTTVHALPVVFLTSSDADNSICAGESVTFTANSNIATSYEFFVNGSSMQSGASATYTSGSLSSGQTVAVRAITANGCSAVSSGITTTVHALPAVSLVSSDSDNVICTGSVVSFSASPLAAAGYEFFVNGISRQSGTEPSFTTSSLSHGQTVTVRVTNSNGCQSTSAGITVTVQTVTATLSSSDADNRVCAGETVIFMASSTIAATFEFFVNGASVQSGASNTYTSSTLTNGQVVTLRATTASGCSANSVGITTTVHAVPAVTLSSSDADNSICAGETVIFTASSTIAATFEFFVNGASVQSGASNSYTSSTLTSGQTVTVRATTASGCSANSAGITTTVYPLPSVSLSSSDADHIACAGETVTFTASSDIATSYEFFVNGNSVQSGAANSYSSSTLTDGQVVTVRVTTASGCSANSASITTMVDNLSVSLVSSDADNIICPAETVTFTASSPTATSYEFFVNGVSVQNSASSSFSTASLSNGQTLHVVVTSSNGCRVSSNSISTTVTALVATLSSSDADNSICAGETVTFTVNAPTATTYEFFVNGVSVQNSATNIYSITTLTSGQTVSARATTASGCSALSNAISTTVHAVPAVTLSSSDADNSICLTEQVLFRASSATATIYEFLINGALVQRGASNEYLTANLTNLQVVSVRAINSSGCSTVSSGIIITVNPQPTVSLSSSDTDNSICAGETVIFTASSDIATSYEFFVNGNSVQSGAANSYSSSTLTDGQVVTVRVTTASGCSANSASITTMVDNLSVSLVSSDADNIICPAETVTFTASSPTATSYEFFVNGVSVQNSASSSFSTASLSNGQTLHVVVTSSNGCRVSSNSISTTVTALVATLSSSDADNSICAGETVTFTVNAPTATTYEFFVNGVSVQNGAAHVYTSTSLADGQVVQARAMTASGCVDMTNSISTGVTTLVATLTSSDADNVICAGEAVTFTVSAPMATTYEFFVDGLSVQHSATNIYTAILSNGQRVSGKASTASGCSALSSGITITVNALPTVSLSSSDADNVICAGEALTFTASSSTATLYEFFVNGVSVQHSATNIFTTTTLASGQSVTVRATTPGGCSVVSSGITTTVYALPTVSLTSSDSDNSICAGERVTFTASSPTATLYEFFVDGASVQHSATNTFTTTGLTHGQVLTVKVSTANGCSTVSNAITTIVNALPTVSLVSSDSDNRICAGEAVTFTANADIATTYEFFVNGASLQNSATNIFTTAALTHGQTVTVRVRTASGCSALGNGITTTVHALPTVSLVSSDSDNSICAGETVTFTASSDIATSYEFFVNGNSVQNGASNRYITSTLTNGQTVTALVTSANGCSTVSSGITFTINALAFVNAGTDRAVCVNSSITLAGSIGGAATNASWSGGKGSFSDVNDLNATYTPDPSEAGRFVVLTLTTNGSGPCSSVSDEVRMTVHALPIVDFSGLAPAYCVDAPAITLTGFPSGGTFSGAGMSGTSFSPSKAGIGTHMVSYSYSDGNGCINMQQRTVTVYPLPVVSFSGFNNIGAGGTALYSFSAAPIELSGFPAGGVFSGKGISGSYFVPAQAGAGTYTIRYSYSDVNGCENFQTQTVTVEPLPTVVIGEVGGPYCANEGDIVLIGIPSGGYFSGDGIVTGTNVFRPSIAKTGANTVRYTYTDVLGGTNVGQKTIHVNAVQVGCFCHR
jgi:uncharacterized cupredoxin-like copper-binding protein